ncbi:helix-turn-helix transcriptional regulator [Dolichospermum sp. FACHB-1091]|nr:helix-turn-helix transcriptional regulator [Dolichospermum sp. FACHB-1091]
MQSAKKKLGQQIAAIRKQKGLTQEKLAELSGYSVEFISLIERGINAPTIDGLEKLAEILDCNVEILFLEKSFQDNSLN